MYCLLATIHVQIVMSLVLHLIQHCHPHCSKVTYAMANQCLAGVVAARAAQSLPACLVDLPAVSEAGHLSRWAHVNEALFASQMGVSFVPMRELAPKLLALLGDGRAGQMVTITPPDVAASMKHLPNAKDVLLQLLDKGQAAASSTVELAPGTFVPAELLADGAAAAAKGEATAVPTAVPAPSLHAPASVPVAVAIPPPPPATPPEAAAAEVAAALAASPSGSATAVQPRCCHQPLRWCLCHLHPPWHL